jgi:hypothetical protein
MAPLSSNGTATLAVNLPAGTDTLTASYVGTSTLVGATSNPVTEVVTPDTTATSLTISPNSAAQNTSITVTAQVTPASSQTVPVGSIVFFDGTTNLATVPVSTSGGATFSSSSFAVGTHALTAVYSGSTNDQPSTSTPQTLVINAQNFTLTAPLSLTIQTEHHADMSFSLTSVGGFSDTVDLTCGNLPQWATCTIANPKPVLDPNQTVSASIYFDTDAVLGYQSELRSPVALRTGIALAMLLPLGLLATARRRKLLRRSTLVLVLVLSASFFSLTGCSGLYPPSVTPGTYTISLTGHGEHTGQSRSATFTLIVTP